MNSSNSIAPSCKTIVTAICSCSIKSENTANSSDLQRHFYDRSFGLMNRRAVGTVGKLLKQVSNCHLSFINPRLGIVTNYQPRKKSDKYNAQQIIYENDKILVDSIAAGSSSVPFGLSPPLIATLCPIYNIDDSLIKHAFCRRTKTAILRCLGEKNLLPDLRCFRRTL